MPTAPLILTVKNIWEHSHYFRGTIWYQPKGPWAGIHGLGNLGNQFLAHNQSTHNIPQLCASGILSADVSSLYYKMRPIDSSVRPTVVLGEINIHYTIKLQKKY